MATTIPTINLLKKTKRVFDKTARKRKRIISMFTIAIVIYFLLILPVVGYRFFLSAQLKSINDDITQKTASINQSSAKEQKYVLLENKLSIISEVLNNRVLFHEKLLEMYSLFPPSSSIKSVNLDKENNELTVNGQVTDVFTFSQLYQSLSLSLVENKYKQIVINSLSRNEDGTYLVGALITNQD